MLLPCCNTRRCRLSYRPLKTFVPGTKDENERAPECDGLTRGIFLVTTFVWDVEGAVLNAARTYGLTEVCRVVEVALDVW